MAENEAEQSDRAIELIILAVIIVCLVLVAIQLYENVRTEVTTTGSTVLAINEVLDRGMYRATHSSVALLINETQWNG